MIFSGSGATPETPRENPKTHKHGVSQVLLTPDGWCSVCDIITGNGHIGASNFDPDWTIRPGVTLAEWIDDADITHGLFAQRLGISEKHLSEIVNGHTGYSAELAIKIAAETGVSVQFWWRLQANWQLDRALGKTESS